MKFLGMNEDGTAAIFELEENDGILMVEAPDGEVVYAAPELIQSSEAATKGLLALAKARTI